MRERSKIRQREDTNCNSLTTETLADVTSEVYHMEVRNLGLCTPHGPILGSGLSLREVVTMGKLLPLTVGSSLSPICELSAALSSSSTECFGLEGVALSQVYNIQHSPPLESL